MQTCGTRLRSTWLVGNDLTAEHRLANEPQSDGPAGKAAELAEEGSGTIA